MARGVHAVAAKNGWIVRTSRAGSAGEPNSLSAARMASNLRFQIVTRQGSLHSRTDHQHIGPEHFI